MKAPKQLPVPLLIGMEDSAKNNADALFFTQLFVPQAPQIALIADEKSHLRLSRRVLGDKRLRNGGFHET